MRADLKWSLWSAERDYWNDHAPTALREMERAFYGKRPPLTLYLSPKKEIRYGTVTISNHQAVYEFRAIWDSPEALVPDNVPEDMADERRDAIWGWFSDDYGFWEGDGEDPISAQVIGRVRARTFAKMLELVDAAEEQLLIDEKEKEKAFDEYMTLLDQPPPTGNESFCEPEIDDDSEQPEDEMQLLRDAGLNMGQP
jgi:hypothetical protein